MKLPSKQDLRNELLRVRQALAAEARARRSASIVAAVRETRQFARSERVAAYVPMLGEVDALQLIAAAREAGKRVYLPRLINDGRLDFAAYDAAKLVPGPRSVMQPAPELPSVPLEEIDLLVVPGLGFDRNRNRIGMGAGYYDRTLANAAACPFTIGVGFDFQLVDQLPIDDWDVPLDLVVTESEIVGG